MSNCKNVFVLSIGYIKTNETEDQGTVEVQQQSVSEESLLRRGIEETVLNIKRSLSEESLLRRGIEETVSNIKRNPSRPLFGCGKLNDFLVGNYFTFCQLLDVFFIN